MTKFAKVVFGFFCVFASSAFAFPTQQQTMVKCERNYTVNTTKKQVWTEVCTVKNVASVEDTESSVGHSISGSVSQTESYGGSAMQSSVASKSLASESQSESNSGFSDFLEKCRQLVSRNPQYAVPKEKGE